MGSKHMEAADLVPTTVSQLKEYMIKRLTERKGIDDETTPIIPNLLTINDLGFITFESQPMNVRSMKFSESLWMQRAYLNGIYPKHMVSRLAETLNNLNANIVVSETILDHNPKLDQLKVFNFKDDGTPLLYGLYPMACDVKDSIVTWSEGYSGNITYPMLREYIMDHFFDLPDELIAEIVDKYSQVQIWSQDIKDNIFPIIIEALR